MFTQCILFESQIYGICLNLIMMFSVFRATASTRMNNASSRSHAIFTIKFTQVWFAFNETHRIFKFLIKAELPWGGGGIRNFGVGMCCWDLGILILYQSYFNWILLPYTRLNSPNSLPPPPPAPDPRVTFRLSCLNLNLPIWLFIYFWVAIPGFPSLD